MDGSQFEFLPNDTETAWSHSLVGNSGLLGGGFEMPLQSLLRSSVAWRFLSITVALGASPLLRSLAFQSPTVIQLNPSTAPVIAEPNVTIVSLTGNGYPAGIINPGQVTVQLQPQAPATGPAMNVTVTSVKTVLGSTRKITFTVVPANSANNVTVPTAYLVSVSGSTAGGATFISGNSAALTVDPPASITSLSPGSGMPGQSLPVTITGSFSNFTQGSSLATFGPGIAVGGAAEGGLGPITVINSTTATAQIAIDSAASLGARTVTVTTGIEVALETNGFQVVSPILTQIAPNTGQQGQQNLSVAVTGQFTHFVQGTTAASFGAGITVASLTVNSPTSATAVLNISASAAAGARTVTLTTGAEVATLANGFTVTNGTPVLTLVNPNTGQQGQQNLSVAVTGQFTHFVQGTTTASFGAGITVASLTVNSATSAIAVINLSASAAAGARNVTLTTGAEVATLANGFTVTAGTPVLTQVNPNNGQQGQQSLSVAVTGLFTHFVQGTTAASFGAGIAVASLTVNSTTSATAVVNISASAATGARNVTVTTGVEVATLVSGFTVTVGTPVLTQVNPNNGQQGQQSLFVAVTGLFTHLVQGTTTASFGAGITVASLTVNSATSAIAVINLSTSATAGARTVTLTTGGEVATLANGFTVTAGIPVLTQVNPNNGQQGQQNLSVAVTGQFTHFVQGTTAASFGAGVTVASLTVNSATSAIAVINLSTSATAGARTVTLTTGGEVATLANGFTVTAGIPVLTQVNPNNGQQGQQNLSVAVTGQFTHFVQGSTAASFGAGITVASLTVNSPTSATAVINLSASAATGARNVTLTTGAESATLANGFTVTSRAPPASIISAAPNTVPQGAQNVTIALAGLDTHFTAGVSQASFGSGITVVSTFVVSSTTVKAKINVDPAATVGARTVVVTTGTEIATLANGLTVEAAAQTAPSVSITAPASTTPPPTLSASTTVTGTVSGTGTVTWTLDYAIGTSTNFTTIATGTGAVNGTLGTFPADLLPNNPYTLRLTASNGQSASTTVAVVVNTGVTKLGSVTLTYQDLALPGLGFPISLRRVYDSTNPAPGDFGSGWTLGYSTVDLTTDANYNVFITLPTGKRTAFLFNPSCGFFGCTAAYTVPQGVYYSIQNNDGCDLFYSGGIWFCGLGGPVFSPQSYTLTAPNGATYALTASGGLTGITEVNGKSIMIGPAGVITNFGKSVVFTRDGSGRITTITDPNNNKLQYAYDALGRLNQVIDEKGNLSTYSYAGSSTLLSNINAPGNCQPVSNQYDSEGRVIGSTDAAGNVTTNTYDSINHTETITNPLGGMSTYHYDANGNLLEVDDPEGGKTSYAYDANNNIILITFPSGRAISETYDGNGNLLTKTVVPTSGPSLTTTYTWTVLNKLASTVFPSGSQQLYQYDAFGNLTSRSMVSAGNTVLYSESFTYDANANQITKTDGLGHTTNYSYDSVGNMLKETDPTNVSTTYTYDSNGNVLSKTDGLGNTTTYQYDQANNLIATLFGGQTVSSSTWDSQAKILSFTDGLGKTTTYGRDCSENLTLVTDPLNNSTSYTYNGLLAITGETDPNNHSTAYAYDQLDRYTSRTTPDGKSTKYSYNADSGISQTTLPSGIMQQNTYDLYGRVVTETAPEKTIAYTFDVDENITQTQEIANSSTRTSTATYDGIDRLSTYTDWAGRTVSYTYDNNSNPLTLTAPDGVVTTNTYDNAGRLSKVQMGTASVQYTYDGDGRKALQTYSNGITSAYNYDVRGRLTSVIVKNASNAVIGSYSYAVDANSNRTSLTLPDGAVTYQYDADQRLTKEQSTSTSLGAYTHTESYDGAGNRLDAGDTFGPDNRLLTDSGGAYSYDNNGNRIGRGLQTYGYDSYNRLTSYGTTGTTATYEYDWEGRRVAKVVNGARREFVYDHARIIAEYNSGVAVAHYAFGADTDEVAIVNRGGNNYFYHQDGLGSVVAITDASGNVVQRYGYDAWGNIKQNTGSFAFSGSGLVNDFTYTGREYDNESALYYYRARSYDPVIGRFLQKDPLQGQLDDPQDAESLCLRGK